MTDDCSNKTVRFSTLPETNIAPKNRWLEYYFPIGFRPIFRCKLLVSGRVGFLLVTAQYQLTNHPMWKSIPVFKVSCLDIHHKTI